MVDNVHELAPFVGLPFSGAKTPLFLVQKLPFLGAKLLFSGAKIGWERRKNR